MAAKQNVRTHTRKTPGGGTTTVHQHGRAGRPRKGVVSPGHAWKLGKKAIRAGRRKKKAVAIGFGALALGELGAWATLSGIALILATMAMLALGVAALMGMATGVE